MPSAGSSFYPANIGSIINNPGGGQDGSKTGDGQQMPNLSATSTITSNDNSAGEVFMGVQSPQPGGVPSWKWTVMSDKK
jgi:hypothetical protein